MTTERPAYRVLLWSLIATLAYATLRYNVFKGVPWSALPVYVLNKALSWSAVILFLAAAWRAATTRTPIWSQAHFRQAFALSTTHMLLTLSIFHAASYPVLFNGPSLTLAGGISTLTGVLALMVLVVCRRGGPGKTLGLMTFPILTGIHLIPLGFAGWWTPSSWPGGMPPITLLSFALCVVALWFLRSATRD